MPADRNEQMADAERNRGGIESKVNTILSYDANGNLMGAAGAIQMGSVRDTSGPASSTGSKNRLADGSTQADEDYSSKKSIDGF